MEVCVCWWDVCRVDVGGVWLVGGVLVGYGGGIGLEGR